MTLDKKMPEGAKDAILLLLRARSLFEMALTDWLVASIKTNRGISALMFHKMNTGTKIDKLKQIYAYVGGDKQSQEQLKN